MSTDIIPVPRLRALFGSAVFAVLVLAAVMAAGTARAQGTSVLTGTVTDADSGEPLIGANVALRESDTPDIIDGTATDTQGNFRLTGLQPGDYVLEVRFVGYRSEERPLTLEAGESRDLTIELRPGVSALETVIVSASRRREKVLDAPASISVLEPEDIQQEVSTSTIEALRTTPGVDMAQTGLDRREVVLRGFNEAFSGATYVLTDYREAAVASLGVNIYSIMPTQSIDLERVEVVRGPGSALYGPGVDAGVIHFFTKDPFDYPGTTLSISGGQRGFFSGQFRQAGIVGDRFGYKITGQFARGDEWELRPSTIDPRQIEAIRNDPNRTLDPDAEEVSRYRIYETRDQVPGNQEVDAFTDATGDTDFRLRRDYDYRKFNVNGLLQYRLDDRTTVSLNGGYASLTSPVQSGIGTVQGDGFGYAYGQLRVRSGPLFAQIYLNRNEAGDSYIYGSGDDVVDESVQWNAQVQYDFAVPELRTAVIAGADADLTRPRTQGEILGRNEENDEINEYGGYAQTTTDLGEKLDLTLALRADYNNIVEEVQFSPRAALVYAVTPQSSVRASFNRAFSSPGTNSNFLDIVAQQRTLAPVPQSGTETFDLVFRGLGSADGFTYNQFRQTNQARFFLPVPGFFKNNFPYQSLPLAPVYGVAAAGLLGSTGQLPEGVLSQLSAQQRQLLAQLLGFTAQNVASFAALATGTLDASAVQLGLPDDSPDGFRPVDGPVDIEPLEQTTTNTFEVGYKGLLQNRVVLTVDGYYQQKKDFVGPLVVESPLVYLQQAGLGQTVGQALGTVFATTDNPTVNALLDQLQSSGIPRPQAAQILAGLVGGALNNQPAAVVQPDQPILPGDDPDDVGAMLSYRNFGEVQYWGIDASIQVLATDALTLFANTSIVSDDFFDNEELDEENESLSLALNAPSFKLRGGFDYTFDSGFQFNAAGHYVEGFPVETGPYVGEIDDYFLLDVGVGYDFEPYVPGLRLNVTAKNVLDNEHREFVGAPELGLTIFGRLVYELR